MKLVVSDDHTSGIGVGVGGRFPFEAIGQLQPVGVGGVCSHQGCGLVGDRVRIGVSWLKGWGQVSQESSV